MRLNGKPAIMRYLGRSEKNERAWQQALLRYGPRIYRLSRTAPQKGYWCRSEDLDEIDLAVGASVVELGLSKIKRRVLTHQQSIVNARASGVIA